jgi:drug/metabolite transporter (DMT)-like permease
MGKPLKKREDYEGDKFLKQVKATKKSPCKPRLLPEAGGQQVLEHFKKYLASRQAFDYSKPILQGQKNRTIVDKKLKAKSLSLIFLCALCWGPSYLFIKLGITDIPPLTLVFLRLAIASAILYVLCRIQKLPIFEWKYPWRQFVFLGVMLNALPFFLISFGELYITSSLAGILNSLTLIFTAIFSHFFGSQERLTKNKIFGIILGLAGLGVIYLPLVLQEGVRSNIGALLVILACLFYGIGTVYARARLKKNIPSLIVLTAQLGVATLILIPFSLLIDHPFALPFPSYQAIIGALGLGVIGTAAGFFFYYKAIQFAGATYASFSVLMVPILAMGFGSFFLDENLTWNLYIGTLLILVGVVAVNPVFNKEY